MFHVLAQATGPDTGHAPDNHTPLPRTHSRPQFHLATAQHSNEIRLLLPEIKMQQREQARSVDNASTAIMYRPYPAIIPPNLLDLLSIFLSRTGLATTVHVFDCLARPEVSLPIRSQKSSYSATERYLTTEITFPTNSSLHTSSP